MDIESAVQVREAPFRSLSGYGGPPAILGLQGENTGVPRAIWLSETSQTWQAQGGGDEGVVSKRPCLGKSKWKLMKEDTHCQPLASIPICM